MMRQRCVKFREDYEKGLNRKAFSRRKIAAFKLANILTKATAGSKLAWCIHELHCSNHRCARDRGGLGAVAGRTNAHFNQRSVSNHSAGDESNGFLPFD